MAVAWLRVGSARRLHSPEGGGRVRVEGCANVRAIPFPKRGAHAEAKHIVASSGQIQTSAGLDYEIDSSYSVAVEVTDGKDAAGNAGSTIDAAIAVTVRVTDVNEPPVVVSQIGVQALTAGGGTRTISLSGKFRDPDGDALSYRASSSGEGVAAADENSGILTITPVAAGAAAVTAYDRPVGGLSVSQTFTVTVTSPHAGAAGSAVQPGDRLPRDRQRQPGRQLYQQRVDAKVLPVRASLSARREQHWR